MNKRNIPIIVFCCTLLLVCLFVLVRKYLPYPVDITYVGEVSGTSRSRCWWTVETKESVLERVLIQQDNDLYSKISRIDGTKYKFIMSYRLPIKKLLKVPETSGGIVKYKSDSPESDKLYIYLIKKNKCIIPEEI